jgi:two-component system chemotaxis response regulator CheY
MTKTALVVDDAAVVRQLCALTLRRIGFNVIEAVDGRDALEKTEGVDLHFVITDMNMPVMDGIELVKQLRQRKETRFVPIVVLSTISQQHKVNEGKAAGASGWIFKPFDANRLRQIVTKFLDQKDSSAAFEAVDD